jgi:chemotaxis protein methyltransferase CheR
MSTTATTAGGITADEFEQVRELVRRRAAIELDDGKEYLVTSRLLPLLRRHGNVTMSELIGRLGHDAVVATEIVDAMTTNETSFFRDLHPFDALRDRIIPDLLARPGRAGRLTIWCAACSSGQEPYSLAIMLAEHFPQLVALNGVRILATDLSPTMVERTGAGRFSRIEVNRGLPAPALMRWFEQDGATFRANDTLRRMIEVRTLNLAEPWAGIGPFDLVLCRNVLIYFSTDTKRTVLTRIRRSLAPGGLLLLGGTESTMGVDDTWDRREYGRTIAYADGPPA